MPKEQESASSKQFSYEANVVVDDAESLQDAVNQLIEKAKEGQMALEMKTEAHSEDGKTFTCFLANSLSNNYDMFMVFYRDDTQEEIYRTGLIPVGARIEEFTLEDAVALAEEKMEEGLSASEAAKFAAAQSKFKKGGGK